MNLLAVVVFAVMASCAMIGYCRGFLRMAYSIAAYFLIFVFVSISTPYLTGLLERTQLKGYLEERCAAYLENMAKEQLAQGIEDYDPAKNTMIPDSVIGDALNLIGETVGGSLEENGAYGKMAGRIARYILTGIAFFIATALFGIFTFWVTRMLNLVSRIPAIRKPDRILGMALGALAGLMAVWLFFYMISLCGTSEFGKQCLASIKESPFLQWLYDNNLLLLLTKKALVQK